MKPAHHLLIAVSGLLLFAGICIAAYFLASHEPVPQAAAIAPTTKPTIVTHKESPQPAVVVAPPPLPPKWEWKLCGDETRLVEVEADPTNYKTLIVILYGTVQVTSVTAGDPRTCANEFRFREYTAENKPSGRSARLMTFKRSDTSLRDMAVEDEKAGEQTGVRVAVLRAREWGGEQTFAVLDWQIPTDVGWGNWQNLKWWQSDPVVTQDIRHALADVLAHSPRRP